MTYSQLFPTGSTQINQNELDALKDYFFRNRAYLNYGQDSNPTNAITSKAGFLYSFFVTNLNPTEHYYLQFFNKMTVALLGDTPIISAFKVGPGEILTVGAELLGWSGLYFYDRIIYGFSATRDNYTPISSNDLRATFWYREF